MVIQFLYPSFKSISKTNPSLSCTFAEKHRHDYNISTSRSEICTGLGMHVTFVQGPLGLLNTLLQLKKLQTRYLSADKSYDCLY